MGIPSVVYSMRHIPGAYSETEEVIELARVAGEYNGIYISHMREEGQDLVKSEENGFF